MRKLALSIVLVLTASGCSTFSEPNTKCPLPNEEITNYMEWRACYGDQAGDDSSNSGPEGANSSGLAGSPGAADGLDSGRSGRDRGKSGRGDRGGKGGGKGSGGSK